MSLEVDGLRSLPTGALLLHIGPPKTGSTAIQQTLHEARETLATHGVLYPGIRRRARSASSAVLGTGPAVGRERPQIEQWRALVAEMRQTDLPLVCLSHENFSRADDAAVDRILGDLGTDRTHVVYVARRLDKVLPSHWQEQVKAWRALSYDEYLHRMLDEPPFGRTIWPPHDVSAVVGRWAARVGHDRVTIVVADEQDRGLIAHTFETMLGLPGGILTPSTRRTNTSLSYTEAEALRALNRMAREQQWTPREYWKVVQAGVVDALGVRPSDDDVRITGLPDWAFDRVAERADRQISAIGRSGVRVHGDPERLRVSVLAQPALLPQPVETVPLDLLATMVQGAVDGARALNRRELREARRTAAAPENLDGRRLIRLLAGRVARRIGLRR
jgi:hypothetical protein